VLGLRLYLRYLGISVRSQMQYRASFVMLSLGHLLVTVTEFAGIVVLFERFGQLGTWRLEEVALFYGLISVSFAVADAGARGFDLIGGQIKSGTFDRILLRPRSAALQIAGQELTLRRVGRLAQGSAIFAWAAVSLDLAWTVPKVALLLASVLGGAALFFGLVVLQATLAFWTTETLEIMNTVTYGGVETAQFPLSIYREGFRRFFTYVVPLACANYYPVLALLDKPDPAGAPAHLMWAAPLVGFAFLAVCLRVWDFGVRHYTSTGS